MNVLIVAPYAPHSQVGAVRIVSLTRYLINRGHEVTVVCLSEDTLKEIDPKGLKTKVPKGVSIIKYDITVDGKSLMRRNAINEKACSIAVKRALDSNVFDVAMVSGGPFYSFYSMKEVKKRGIPYLVDYRDLHLSSPDKRKRNKFLDKVKFLISFPARYYQEASCLHQANHITVVSPQMIRSLSSYFHVSEDKFTVAYNGYDDAILNGIRRNKNTNGVFTIGYFGKLMYYNQEYTKMLFRVLEEANKKKCNLKFLHIGPENIMIENYFEEEKMNLSNWYECTGQMNYKAGMEVLSDCDVCALEYTFPEGPGTKIFDYIYLNKPVIAITKQGIPLEKMLKTFDHAYICHTEEDIRDAIKELTKGHITTLIDGEQALEIIGLYSRSRQNKIFEDAFKMLVYRV